MVSEWQELTVNELVDQQIIEKPMDGNHGEIHPKSSDYVTTGVPFIMASDISDGHVDTLSCKFIPKQQADCLRKGFSISGDVLLSHKATIGRTAVVEETHHEYVMLTPQVTYYRIKDPTRLNNRYLRYYFESAPFQEIFNQWAGGGSTRAYLGITGQRKLPIVLPPLPEQKAIAHILGSLDDKIELNRKMNATLEAMAQALFKSWFVDFDPVIDNALAAGKPIPEALAPRAEIRRKVQQEQPELFNRHAELFPSAFIETDELGPIPEGWEMKSLSNLAKVSGGKQLDKSLISNTGTFPVFGGAGLMGYTLSPNANGEVITFGRVGAYCGQFVYHRGPCWINNNASRVEAFYGVPSKWLYRTLMNIDLEPIKRGAAQPFISNGDLLKQPLLMPSENIKRRFERVLVSYMSKQEKNNGKTEILTKLRDTLLPKLISGELSGIYA
jgi:type I restriction enzyme S subunit